MVRKPRKILGVLTDTANPSNIVCAAQPPRRTLKGVSCMTPLDRERFAKVLAMLASPHPGEAAVAAQKALDLLNAADMTWTEVLTTPADSRAELLQAKIIALKASNNRLRA